MQTGEASTEGGRGSLARALFAPKPLKTTTRNQHYSIRQHLHGKGGKRAFWTATARFAHRGSLELLDARTNSEPAH